MGELIERDFTDKKVNPIKEFHKKYRRKFDPERDVLIALFHVKTDKFDILSDDLFQAIVFQDNNRLNRIIKDTDPYDLMEIVEGESFKVSMSALLNSRGNMKDFNLGIKKFYNNFKKRLSRKIKNAPKDII